MTAFEMLLKMDGRETIYYTYKDTTPIKTKKRELLNKPVRIINYWMLNKEHKYSLCFLVEHK